MAIHIPLYILSVYSLSYGKGLTLAFLILLILSHLHIDFFSYLESKSDPSRIIINKKKYHSDEIIIAICSYSQTSKYLSGGKMKKEIHGECLEVIKPRRKAGFWVSFPKEDAKSCRCIGIGA